MGEPDRCPRCESPPTNFHDSYSDGEEVVKAPRNRQRCVSASCGLPCRLWSEFAAMQAVVDAAVEFEDNLDKKEAIRLLTCKKFWQALGAYRETQAAEAGEGCK